MKKGKTRHFVSNAL